MQFLQEKGTNSIFLLTGNGAMYINDAIAKCEGLKYVCVRHEVAAPMMAESYARLCGNLGVVCVTSGPGATNAVAGLAEAWVDSGPIMILSGQSPMNQMPKENSLLKVRSFGTAGFDIIPVVRPMTKYAVTIRDAKSIRFHLEKAYHFAMESRQGPVWIDLPMDIQYEVIEPEGLEGYKPDSNLNTVMFDIDSIIKLLKNSKKPLIIAGQGIRQSNALDDFNQFISLLNIPIAFSRLGQDILPYSYKLNMGQIGRRGQKYSKELLAGADLIIVLGCRLATAMAGVQLEHFNKTSKIIMVDIDPAELEFHGERINMKVLGNVKNFLKQFNDAYQGHKSDDWNSWNNACLKMKSDRIMFDVGQVDLNSKYIDLYHFMSRLDALTNQKDILITDAGSNYYVGGQVYRFEKGQREITSGAYAAMGLSIPLAVGAAVAKPNSQIVAVTGDGSLELNIQELKTISYYGLNVKLFVINNGGYVSMRNWQDNFFDGRRIGSDDDTGAEMLNLEMVAKTYELEYFLIEGSNNIDKCLEEIFKKSSPMFIEVICDPSQKIVQPYAETETSS
jgi:acetolactate synthase-1/2/3 large subunit